jgi:hypothetical protein
LGEQIGDNIVEADTFSRTMAMKHRHPLLALLDIAQAFPSLLHAWIMCVFRARGFPAGFCNLLLALYHLNVCYIKLPSGYEYLYLIFTGVLQGCPLSGLVFAVSIDPIVSSSARVDHQTGSLSRWCADDLASVLPCPDALTKLHRVFVTFSPLTGLHLNPKKFVIVLLARDFTAEVEYIQSWLDKHLPEWAQARISDAGKYLGIWLGPTAGRKHWKDEAARWANRSQLIKRAATSAFLTAEAYNTYCVSLLGYAVHFHFMPQSLLVKESALLASLLRIPYRRWGTHGPHMLSQIGLA